MNGFEELSEVTFFNPFFAEEVQQDQKRDCTRQMGSLSIKLFPSNFDNDITYTLATFDNNIRSSSQHCAKL